MLETHELRQLIAVAECGTLSAAAERLHITQPVLSRSMKKIEEKLNLSLFTRRGKNSIQLNEAGLLAVGEARNVITALEAMEMRLDSYARSLNTVSIGSCAPGPLWSILPELAPILNDKSIVSELRSEELLLAGLISSSYTLIVTEHPVERSGVVSSWYSSEQLHISLPVGHRLSGRDTIRLSELDGETILLLDQLGSWEALIRSLPEHAKFIVQKDRRDYAELVRASSIPCFASNMTGSMSSEANPRVEIPIADREAWRDYYLSAREKNRSLLEALIEA